MKKLFIFILNACICSLFFSTSILAYDDEVSPAAQVCPITQDYVLVRKTVSSKVQYTDELINELNTAQPMEAHFSRTVQTSASAGVNIELVEDLIGLEAELSIVGSTTKTLSATPTVPANSTVYVDFGYKYVQSTIKIQTINSDCSLSYSGPISVFYTYGSYIRIYD